MKSEHDDGAPEVRVAASLADAQAGRLTRHASVQALMEHLDGEQEIVGWVPPDGDKRPETVTRQGEAAGYASLIHPTGLDALPNGWTWAKLGDVCKTTSGGTPSRKNAEYFTGDIPWVKSGELPDGLVREVEERITEEAVANSSAKLFPAGTLLIALYGATVGKLGILKEDATTNQAVCAIFPPEHLDTKYLFWYLRFVRSDLVAQAVGGAQPNISQGILRELPIPVPPLDQQKRIVAEIEKQFSRLDEAVANLKRVKANLKRYKAAVLKAAVEGRLVDTEAERARRAAQGSANVAGGRMPGETEGRSYETGAQLLQRILETRRSQWQGKGKYKEPAAPDTTDLPELPADWVWATWDQISQWVTYGFTRPMPHVDEGIPIVTAKHVVDGKIELNETHKTPNENYVELSDKDRPEPGDILITKDGTIGRAAVVPEHNGFCINQSVAVIWLRSCPIDRQFLLAVIDSELVQKPVREKARGVAIKHLSITDFARLPLPLPPMDEQRRIVSELDRRLTLLRVTVGQVDANLQRAERLRQSVLSKAFSGDSHPISYIGANRYGK